MPNVLFLNTEVRITYEHVPRLYRNTSQYTCNHHFMSKGSHQAKAWVVFPRTISLLWLRSDFIPWLVASQPLSSVAETLHFSDWDLSYSCVHLRVLWKSTRICTYLCSVARSVDDTRASVFIVCIGIDILINELLDMKSSTKIVGKSMPSSHT